MTVATRLPHVTAYLDALPGRPESFRSCEVRREVLDRYSQEFARLARDPGVPESAAKLLSGKTLDGWVPEVDFQLAHLAVRDLAFTTDAAFHQWTFSMNKELFDKPLLRTLMRLLSPTLVILGASKRWHALHRGSTLTTGKVEESNGRVHTTARLTFPSGLFSRLFLEGLEHGFAAAVAGARGLETRVELQTIAEASADYRISFRA